MLVPESIPIHDYLTRIGDALADYLEKQLPCIDYNPDWWEVRVLSSLKDFAKRKAIENNLHSLDLAALLSVFDDNWTDIRKVANLNYSLMNYLKEMRTIRNQWMHQDTANPLTLNEIERYLSTFYLFCKGIDANQSLLSDIEQARINITNLIYGEIPKYLQKSKDNDDANNKLQIKEGTLIRLLSRPEMIASVSKISNLGPDYQYTVYVNGKKQTWYHSQIEVVEETDNGESVSQEEFNAFLTAKQINNPNAETLYSLNAAKIDIIPHQFRPVLKFIKSDYPRLLIADGVGVGKTIEAGLILKELEARNEADSVLILCPKALVTERKWQTEMKERFSESFVHMSGSMLRQAVRDMSRVGWDMDQYGKVIMSYSLFHSKNTDKKGRYPGLYNDEKAPEFDLVIVDEAHTLKSGTSDAYVAVKYFVSHAKAVIFLTATPIQMGERDLFVLLNLLRPDMIPDETTFTLLSEPNPFINSAVSVVRAQNENWKKTAKNLLLQAAGTSFGKGIYPSNPKFIKVINQLDKSELSDEERVELLTDIDSLHSFSSIINRTRRRDIDCFYATRKTQTIEVQFTPEQKEVYDKVLNIQADILSVLQPTTPAAFMMNTLMRRAASCLPGLVPFLKEILTTHMVELDEVEMEIGENIDEISFNSIDGRIRDVLRLAENLPDIDMKYDRLLEVLREKQTQTPNKVMIFSTFRHTLYYLHKKLSADGFRVGLVHGGIPDDDRRNIRELFALDKDESDALDILLFSEVGCEGLDYQFCDCMVNYDLPWNPMKIEQRIGRIDRTGQKSESVFIFNMITTETVDAAIYNRCLSRIGIFEEAVGGNEEILGEISRELADIGTNFKMTEKEREEKLDQITDNLIRKNQELESLAKEEGAFFGLSLPSIQAKKEIEDATSFLLSPASIENLVRIYFKKRLNADGDFIIGDKSTLRIRMNADCRAELFKDYKKLLPKYEYSSWDNWLSVKNTDPYYPISFSHDDKSGNLISTSHPLVKQAAAFLEKSEDVFTTLTVIDSQIPEGKYPFGVYMWSYSGMRRDQKIIPVTEDFRLSEKLKGYIQIAATSENPEEPDEESANRVEIVQHDLWMKERERYKQKTLENINYKRETLRQNHVARMAQLQQIIDNSNDDNIRRMKRQQKTNEDTNFTRLMDGLKHAELSADVESIRIGFGIIQIRGK